MNFKNKDGNPLLPFTNSEEVFEEWKILRGNLADAF